MCPCASVQPGVIIPIFAAGTGRPASKHGAILSEADSLSITEKTLLQNVSVAVFTMGGRGARAVTAAGDRAVAPACGVTVIDTVGAGDFFCGAFLAAYRTGATLATCVACGCAAGAAVVQRQGAELPIAEWQALTAVYNELVPLPVTLRV